MEAFTSSLPGVLRLGSTGPSVTLLHSHLLRLPPTIPLSTAELATATFGTTTRLSILDFQRRNSSKIPTGITGIVDPDTSTAILDEATLKDPDPLRPQTYFVAGRVLFSDGSPAARRTVELVDQDLRVQQTIGGGIIGGDGFFFVQGARGKMVRPKKPQLSLLVRVRDINNTVLYEPVLQDLVFSASVLELKNITLEQRSPTAPSADEFTQLLSTLDTLLPPDDGVIPSAAADAMMPRILRLREDEKRSDLTYLSLLQPTVIARPVLTQLVLSYRVASFSVTQHQASVPPAFFYALLGSDLLNSGTAETPANVATVDVDLDTAPELLLYKSVRLPMEKVVAAVNAAVEKGKIAPIDTTAILAALAKLRNAAEGFFKLQPTVEDRMWAEIGKFLKSGQERALREVLEGGNVDGNLVKLLVEVVRALSTTKPTAVAGMGEGRIDTLGGRGGESDDIESRTVPMSGVMLAERAEVEARELARQNPEEIASLLSEKTHDDEPDILPPLERAQVISRELELEHPTASFAGNLARHLETEMKVASSDVGSDQSVYIGEGAARINATRLARFLDENSEFDFQSTNVDLYIKSLSTKLETKMAVASSQTSEDAVEKPDDAEPSLTSDLKTVQRIFKLAPTFSQTLTLLSHSIHSSSHIHALGLTGFTTLLSTSPSFTTSAAKTVYQKATAIHLGTTLLFHDLQSAGQALTIAGLGNPLPPKTIEAVQKDFPNLKSLFDAGDVCHCSDCMTAYSPSAYLVDVLQFLGARRLLESPGGVDAGLTARDVLKKRRPDILELDLSCANTNTVLPVIDIVIELLEDIVAPDSGGSFNGAVKVGVISPQLGGYLRDTLKLPFTDAAVVSGPDVNSCFIVRDTTAAIKLLPTTTATTWKVQLLRNTYGSPEALAAEPAYRNRGADTRLWESTFLPHLPFDVVQMEVTTFFTNTGGTRAELISVLSPSPPPANSLLTIAREELALTTPQLTIITTPDPFNPNRHWNTASSDPLGVLPFLHIFLAKSQLTYPQLEELLRAKGYVNPAASPRGMYIKHLDASCRLEKKMIANVGLQELDRVQRFLRLWRALEGKGWSMAALDRAISAPYIGRGKLEGVDGRETVVRIAEVSKIAAGAKESVMNIISLFDLLPFTSSEEGENKTTELKGGNAVVTYNSIYLNPQKTLTPHTHFDPAQIRLNRTAPPNSRRRLRDYTDYISRCLSIPPETVADLIDDFETRMSLPAPTLDFLPLSQLYALVAIAQNWGIAVHEVMAFSKLAGKSAVSTPHAFLQVKKMVDEVRAAGFTAEEVWWVTHHRSPSSPSTPDSTLEISGSLCTKILTSLTLAFNSAKEMNKSPFDPAATSEENRPAVLTLLSQLPGITALDVAAIGNIIAGGGSAEDRERIEVVLKDIPGAREVRKAITEMLEHPEDEGGRLRVLEVLAGVLRGYFYRVEKWRVLGEVVGAGLGLQEEVVRAIVRRVGRLEAFLEEDAAVEEKVGALRVLGVIKLVVGKLRFELEVVEWVLDNAGVLGWMEFRSLPTSEDEEPVELDRFLGLLRFARLLGSGEWKDVVNPDDPDAPLSLLDLLALTVTDGVRVDQLVEYLSTLAGWERDMLSQLTTHLGATVETFRNPGFITKLEIAVDSIKKLNLTAGAAIQLTDHDQPTPADVTILRDVLRAKYPHEEWLNVLKSITDPLRILRRDALIAFILATNSSLTSAIDISEHLLIDIQTSPATVTSRIIQSHSSAQLLVARLKMGLEATPIIATVSEETAWKQWDWMQQYRLWEANKKVFLYPENWIEPDLRDNKSEIYRALEETLLQNELDEEAVKKAVGAYLEAVEAVADLEVVAMHYDPEGRETHVLAKTRGNPPGYYWRAWRREMEWAPWEAVRGVEITGRHVLLFVREGRLVLVWPEFAREGDPSETKKAPRVPNPDALRNPNRPDDDSANRKERVVVQLALTERNPKTGKWAPKKVSIDPVFVHPSNGSYVNATDIPETLEENITLRYMDLKNLGQVVAVCRFDVLPELDTLPRESIIGVYNLAGCRGYPEPVWISYDRRYAMPVNPMYEFLPRVEGTGPSFQQLRKPPYTPAEQLAVATVVYNDANPPAILGKTYGRFFVTAPSQLAMVDWIVILLQLYAVSRRKTKENRFVVPYGTFAPFVYGDTKAFLMTPGFDQRDGKGATRTVSDVYEFVERSLLLVRRHLKTYYDDPNRDIAALRRRVEVDQDYVALKKEWLDVYVRGYDAMGIHATGLYHPLMCDLRKTFYRDGVDGLMSRSTQLTRNSFDFNVRYQPAPNVRKPYPIEDLDFSLGGAYASYNWELFFHLPFQLAQSFAANQKFDVAVKWFHRIFNPQGDETPDPDPENPAAAPQRKYWVTKPFYKRSVAEYAEQLVDAVLRQVGEHPDGMSLADVLKYSIQQWREKPYSPHAIARTRTVAYQLAVVFRYIENLLNWGDNLFRQLTRETVNQAAQLYITVDKLLGPKPRVIPPAVKTPPRTYNELAAIKVDLLGNALLELENLVPDLGELPHDGAELPTEEPLSALYFGIPRNEKMLEYWDRVADRLFKIRHSQNIDGVFVSLALTSPPIDPGMLVKAFASGASLGNILAGMAAPLPSYRFWFMAERATAMVAQVTQLGSSLLSMLQYRDAEGLSRLRSTLEMTVLRAISQTKAQAIKEAEAQLQALDTAKAITLERQTYFASRAVLNPAEMAAMMMNQVSLGFDDMARMMMMFAGQLFQIPTFSVGISGFGGSPSCSVSMGGSQGGALASAHANMFASSAGSFAKMAGMAATKGSYDRRKEEWDFQKRLAEKELAHVDQQKAVTEARRELLLADQKAHEASIEASRQTDQYMRSKYTNRELYDWSIARISRVYFTAYELAYSYAKQAERCFSHELADYDATPFIKFGYWDSLHSGLLAGETLAIDIKQMEAAFITRNHREYELTKNISLHQLDPFALTTLRATGTCTFSLPEPIFDLDTPGHYLRRTKSIALSIPCVTGPLTTTSAKLSQVSNRYRAKPTLLDSSSDSSSNSAYAESPPGADPRFRYNIATTTTTIVTSSATTDPGIFDLRSSDSRYLPFEGAGVLGTYTLTLPTLRAWDYSTISDVLLHVAYTAREGGSRFRAVVEKEIVAAMNGMLLDAQRRGLYLGFSVRRTWPDVWARLRKQQPAEVRVTREMLPVFVRAAGREVVVREVVWVVRVREGEVGLMVGGEKVELRRREGWEGVLVGTGGVVEVGRAVEVRVVGEVGEVEVVVRVEVV